MTYSPERIPADGVTTARLGIATTSVCLGLSSAFQGAFRLVLGASQCLSSHLR